MEGCHIYLSQEASRDAVLPNLDGLYGGTACKTQDGKKLTKYLEKDGEDHYFGADDYTVSQGECDVQLCHSELTVEAGGEDDRCISVWSEWKEWGRCNKDCGDEGRRIRKRLVLLPYHFEGPVFVPVTRPRRCKTAGRPDGPTPTRL